MKTIGLLGGMSWESTVLYYQIINRTIKDQLGGLHSAKCLLHSVDFAEIEACQANGDWDKAGEILSAAAKNLEQIGADFIVICTNTMHKLADQIQNHLSIPILHIADLTAEELIKNGIEKIALLGTKYTMEQDFYKSRLIAQGIEVFVPDHKGIELVNNIIYNELCLGIVSASSKQAFLSVLEKLSARGAQAAILGCTEIGLLIKQEDTEFSLFDTTIIHAQKAAWYAIQT